MKRTFTIFCFLWLVVFSAKASTPQFSTAGFYALEESGRSAHSMNPVWRFYKGDAAGAEQIEFNDRNWEVVSLPHSIEYLPAEASGGVNYQGAVWYRKHFTPDASLKGKKQFLHFEAIMGKSKIYINGTLVKEQFGGYLPVIVDLSDHLRFGQDNLIAVWADNSDDPIYPPGKPQNMLDFAYFGGIYRDCWLISHSPVYITDPNYEDECAGGGLFVSYEAVSEASATINLQAHLRNGSNQRFNGSIEYELLQPDGKSIAVAHKKLNLPNGAALHVTNNFTINTPLLWSPEKPTLYHLCVRIRDAKGTIVDGYRRRIGIRSIEFKGKEGFWLNGKPYEAPLIGANRHQDFAVIGNALSNSLHWRDAKKLRDAGLKVIRNAHYPQDPAFMDACDELGLFVIVNTPGWQFWNDEPIFAERIYHDIRNMVRRDRNHPSVWLWEPVLNETYYPDDFAKNVRDLVDAEYPYPYCYSGCDKSARGSEYFPVQFTFPFDPDGAKNPDKTYFTREWGDYVDTWISHNSLSRASRSWGERPMLIQAQHYAAAPYDAASCESFYQTGRQHVGGCLWHSFDHQRGYHPDPFYGGIMDAFRQPKYAYYMFQAQRNPAVDQTATFETGPMVRIAHEMTPFSEENVVVYSNCDEVRLTVNKEDATYTYRKNKGRHGMPSPVIVFKNAFNFTTDRNWSLFEGKQADIYMIAEGIIDGKVVATHRIEPSRRPAKIILWCDDNGLKPTADGSDLVTIVAAITDERGNIKRLNNQYIRFEVAGEGKLIGSPETMTNPVPVQWGTAPVLLQTTTTPGKIKVTATLFFEGSLTPLSGELELTSAPASFPLIFDRQEAASQTNRENQIESSQKRTKSDAEKEIERLQKEVAALKLKEVERQQADFGEKR